MNLNDKWVDQTKLKGNEIKTCQCCTCERVFHLPDENNQCPYCKSGNWIWGFIDEPEPDEED
jgi:hypothetical protein